jgi:hypothetical protein
LTRFSILLTHGAPRVDPHARKEASKADPHARKEASTASRPARKVISQHARQAARQDNYHSSVVKQYIKITIKILNLHSLSYFGSKARRSYIQFNQARNKHKKAS